MNIADTGENESHESESGNQPKFRRLFRYFGSKWKLAGDFISMMPPHVTYVEPFFGSGAVFFNKPLAKVNILNDLDSNVWNFFTVLREHPGQLKAMLELTPYSRDFLTNLFSKGFSKENKIEWAWEFYCWMSMSRGASSKICKQNITLRRSYLTSKFVEDFCYSPNNFADISKMLKKATIENRCVLKILDDLEALKEEDKNTIFVYMDPPYSESTRGESHKYNVDICAKTNNFEDDFLDKTSKSSIKMMISGFECDKYAEAFKGWNKRQWTVQDECNQLKTETVWYNYDAMQQGDIC